MSEALSTGDNVVVIYDGPSDGAQAEAIVAALPAARSMAVSAEVALDDVARSAAAHAS